MQAKTRGTSEYDVNQYGYGLLPVTFRVPTYGFLLSLILYMQSYSFDAKKLMIVVCFSAAVAILETFWRKGLVKKKISWYLFSLVLMCFFLAMLMDQAVKVQHSWYKTNVIEKRIQGVIGESPLGIIVFDGKSNVKKINDSALALTEWTREEIVGKRIDVFIPKNKIGVHAKHFQEKVDGLKDKNVVWSYVGDKMFPMLTKSGELIQVKMYVVGVNYDGDSSEGVKGDGVEFYAIIQPIGELAGEISVH
jgi:PAS domain S-box-containing protein